MRKQLLNICVTAIMMVVTMSSYAFAELANGRNSIPEAISIWTFDNANNLMAGTGIATLHGATHSKGNVTIVSDPADAGITAVNGPTEGNGAISVPVGSSLLMTTNLNTPSLSSYSFLMDIHVADLNNFTSLYQADLTNTNDGDLFIYNGQIGLGALGGYYGMLTSDGWYRVLFVVTDNYAKVYLNGILLGQSTSAFAERWLMATGALFFADDDGEEQLVEISELRFWNIALTDNQIWQLGSVFAAGSDTGVGEYVDLGLPSGTLWATCNVGASCPEEYGTYYAWGETKIKSNYSWSTYKYCNGSKTTMTKYCTESAYGTIDDKTKLDPADDAATINWGSDWQMPDKDQMEELTNGIYTTTTWMTKNGVNGMLITSKSNGKSIFLPATGYRADTGFQAVDSRGYYWTSSLYTSHSCDAYDIRFDSNKIDMSDDLGRYFGQSVRPVRKQSDGVNITYTVSPSSWTDVPTDDVIQGLRTYRGGLLQAKATVSGKTATFTLKKSDGSIFQNRGHIVVHSGSIDGTIVKSNVSYEAGIQNPTVDFDLDFTSGRRKYIVIIKSGDYYYYTNPITISAGGASSDEDLVISGGSYFNTPILTTGKEFPFEVKVNNNGSKSWRGSFSLKCGREEWLRWDNVTIGAGGTGTLTKSYTPQKAGRKTLTLFYQTGGSGSEIEVDGGNLDNPFTLTVADPPSSDKLATPDKNTFAATNPTETSFIASWGAVEGAEYYDINVRKVGGDYANADYNGGSSTTSTKVTGLTPGTSYKFQIRARNGNASQNSDWSASLPTAVTTKKAGTEPANLSIYAVRGFDGKTPLTVGTCETYKVYVVNNGTSDWYGSFYLKDGDTNLKAWHNIPLMGNAKAVQPLDFDYIPESAGEKTLTLYYQTNTSGSGLPVNAEDGMNPMTVQVSPDPSAYDGLKLTSAIVYPETLELGQKATISAEVQNTGDTECVAFLTDNNITISDPLTVSAGQTRTIRTTTWEPQIAGTHSIAVEFKPKNSTKQQLVDASVFTNPVSILVSNEDVLSDASQVIITHLTKSIVPSEVTPGSIVYYHFRLLDENGKRLRGMKLKFTRTNTTLTHVEETEPSDNEGYAILSLQTEGGASVGLRGETVTYECTAAISETGKTIPVSGKSSDDTTVTLTIHDGNTFSEGERLENVGKASFTLGVGLSGKADWKKHKGKVSGNAKTTFGIIFNDNGEIEEYSIDGYGGLSGSGSLEESRSLLRELGIDDGTATYWSSLITPNAIKLGANLNVRWGSTTDNAKDLLVRTIMSYVDSYTEGTSEAQDFMVKALRYWYAKERKDTYSWNWSYGGNAAVTFQLLNTWPGNSWARPLVMPIVRYTDLGLALGGSYTVEPKKIKETWNSTYEDYYRTGNGATSWGDEHFSHERLSGSSSSLSLSGTFDAKLELEKLCARVNHGLTWI